MYRVTVNYIVGSTSPVIVLFGIANLVGHANQYQTVHRELKTARNHMMPPPLHLSDIHYKCFTTRRCHDRQKGAMSELMNESVMSAAKSERYCMNKKKML